MNYDAIVVGGGIVGCACAYSLSFDFPNVAVVEPEPIGGGATAAGMGHIVVMDDSDSQFQLTRHSQSLWDELAHELPSTAEFERRGTLWVAFDEEEFAHIEAKAQYHRSGDVRAEVLDSKALREAEPNLKEGLPGALFIPGDSVVFPMPVAAWLLERAMERGCKRVFGRARKLSGSGVVLEDGVELSGGVVVNAAGDLAAELTSGLAVQPRKGHLAITDRYPGFVNHQIVELGYLKSAHSMHGDSVAFNLQPRATGQLLIGSSRQFVEREPSIDRQVCSKMMRRSFEFVPKLADLKVIRIWTGFRAATPDKLPLIGPWPEDPGLWIAAGHEGLGITTSLATGKLLADLVTGRPPALDPRPFDPSRTLHAHSH